MRALSVRDGFFQRAVGWWQISALKQVLSSIWEEGTTMKVDDIAERYLKGEGFARRTWGSSSMPSTSEGISYSKWPPKQEQRLLPEPIHGA